jgi:hypothetical protein
MTSGFLPQRRHSRFPCLPAAEAALRHHLVVANGRLWSCFGFIDAFAANGRWILRSYRAINQGSIVAMIEKGFSSHSQTPSNILSASFFEHDHSRKWRITE